MISVLPANKAKCCGCDACEQACPVNCITLVVDEEGFSYPKVDEQKCIGCGKCERVCPVLDAETSNPSEHALPIALGGYHQNEGVRSDSSSGGIFSLLAEHVLEQGGVVFGCALDEQMHARHIMAESLAELPKLRGSKYVQSDMRGVYQTVKTQLTEGRQVLFVGTPCQVSGLRCFLGRPYDNLLTCDFICHGVPSPKVFADYIAHLESRRGSRVTSYRFRNKDRGWNQSGLQLGPLIRYADGGCERIYPAVRDSFMCGFLSNLYLRPICHECPFKTIPKAYADLTIADFWGVGKCYPELYDHKGTSLVLVNSAQGLKTIDALGSSFFHETCDFAKATRTNSMLTRPTKTARHRGDFFRLYLQEGYARAAKRYLGPQRWVMFKIAEVAEGILARRQGRRNGS